jgi:hypothetical protein
LRVLGWDLPEVFVESDYAGLEALTGLVEAGQCRIYRGAGRCYAEAARRIASCPAGKTMLVARDGAT